MYYQSNTIAVEILEYVLHNEHLINKPSTTMQQNSLTI